MNSKKRHIRRTKKCNRSRKARGGAATPLSKNNRVDLPSSESELDSAQESVDLQIIPPMLPPIHHPVIYSVNGTNMNEVNDDATTENDNISVHSNNSVSTVEYGGKKYTKMRKRPKNRRTLKRRR
jgi:hypothetical protein